MIEIGQAAEIVAVAVPVCAAGVTIYKIRKSAEKKETPKCPVHPMMVERLNRGDKQFKEISEGIQLIKGIVLALAVKAEIAQDAYKDLVK